jgi:DNA-binding transcriptional LysR family regulator
MDVGLLRVFKAVVEEGSLSKASDRLCCVQSNVTARIRQLEGELGVQLFYRRPRGVVPTAPAKTLAVYADRVLRLIDDAKKAVTDTETARGVLSVGTTETAAAIRLPSIFSAFHRRNPEVDLRITMGFTNPLIEHVQDYTLDLAIVNGRAKDPSVEHLPLFEEELVLAASLNVESVETVEKRTLLVAPFGCAYRARAEQWVQESGLLPFRIMEFGNLEGMLGCVAAGMGITVVPISVIRKFGYDDKVRVHALPDQYNRITTYVVRRSDTIRTKAIEVFLDMLMEDARRISHPLELAAG